MVFWNFLITLMAPSGLLHSKKFQKTLILAFEANSVTSLNRTFLQILEHCGMLALLKWQWCDVQYCTLTSDYINFNGVLEFAHWVVRGIAIGAKIFVIWFIRIFSLPRIIFLVIFLYCTVNISPGWMSQNYLPHSLNLWYCLKTHTICPIFRFDHLSTSGSLSNFEATVCRGRKSKSSELDQILFMQCHTWD